MKTKKKENPLEMSLTLVCYHDWAAARRNLLTSAAFRSNLFLWEKKTVSSSRSSVACRETYFYFRFSEWCTSALLRSGRVGTGGAGGVSLAAYVTRLALSGLCAALNRAAWTQKLSWGQKPLHKVSAEAMGPPRRKERQRRFPEYHRVTWLFVSFENTCTHRPTDFVQSLLSE